MAIQSVSEFEAVLGQVIVKLDKVLYERGDPPKLKDARRSLSIVLESAKENEKLKANKDRLASASEVVRVEISGDEQLLEALWDLGDFIDFRT